MHIFRLHSAFCLPTLCGLVLPEPVTTFMLVIRLQRTGRRNAATFRMVVAEHTAPVKGKFLEVVGHYLPTRDPVEIEVQPERITHWISVGAIPSDTVARLLVKNGMKEMEKYVKTYTKKKPRKEVEEAPEAAAPTPPPAETPPETPAEEAPKEESAPAEEKPAEKEEEKQDEEKKEEPAPTKEAPTEEEAPAKDEAPEKEEKQTEDPVEEGDSDKKE